MLNSDCTLNMRSSSIKQDNFSHYTHDCVKAFIKIGFRLKLNMQCWEHIADMYIWHNPDIIESDAHTGK